MQGVQLARRDSGAAQRDSGAADRPAAARLLSRDGTTAYLRCSPHLEQCQNSLSSAIIAASSIHDPSFHYQKTSLSLRLSVFHLQARIGHQPAQAVIATRIVLYV